VKRIVVCADDYNIAPGVSKAIRELIAQGRLNATSVMTLFPGLEEEANALLATPSPVPLQIGLHLTLSGGFAPRTASYLRSPRCILRARISGSTGRASRPKSKRNSPPSGRPSAAPPITSTATTTASSSRAYSGCSSRRFRGLRRKPGCVSARRRASFRF
jgi:hypothetical protein